VLPKDDPDGVGLTGVLRSRVCTEVEVETEGSVGAVVGTANVAGSMLFNQYKYEKSIMRVRIPLGKGLLKVVGSERDEATFG